jgi:hypothetical protein
VRDAWLGLYREVMLGKAEANQGGAEEVEQEIAGIKEIDSFSH